MTHIVDSNKKVPPCPKCGVVPTKHAKNDRILLCGCFGEYGAMTADVVSLQKYQLMCVDMLGRACRELGIETVEQLNDRMAPDPRVAVAVEALEKLARLGNGDRHGNSIGNCIAIDALKQIAAQRGEVEG